MLLSVCMMLSCFTAVSADEAGTSEENPILISTVEDLTNFATTIKNDSDGSAGKYWKLTNDLDLSGIDDWGWQSVGSRTEYPFKGNFDGAGHVIRNVNCNLNFYYHPGIFGVLDGNASVKNLGVENMTISTLTYWTANAGNYCAAGAIAGEMKGSSTIENCYAKNVGVLDKDPGWDSNFVAIGGLTGMMSDQSSVKNCYATGFTITSHPTGSGINIEYNAGLVGKLTGGAIENCYTETKLTTTSGSSYTVTNSYGTSDCGVGSTVTLSEIKSCASKLGEAFKNNAFGYPLLKWQSDEIPLSGNGTADSPYLISNAADLETLSLIENTDGVFFKLTADIDLGGAAWYGKMIGSEANPFKGDFNGDGNVIKNFTILTKIGNDTNNFNGLFAWVGGNALIHDLGVEDVTFTREWWSYKNIAGGMIGKLIDNASVVGCFAKNITFNRPDENDQRFNQGHYYATGGLIGEIDGAGCEVRRSYSLNVDNAYRESIVDGQDKAGSMYNAGLVGIGTSFAEVEDCYSTQPMMQSKPGNPVNDCYQGYNHTNYYDTYPNWGAWQTEVNNLSFNWNSYFEPRSESGLDYPVLKREANDGKYINLIPAGSMTLSDPEAVFGLKKAEKIAAADSGRRSAALKLAADEPFKYSVNLTEGKYYKVTFKGYVPENARTNLTFALGGNDLTNVIKKAYLGGAWWDEKTAYVKASSTGAAELTIGADKAFYIDDVEVFEVNEVLEKSGIDFNLQLVYQKLDKLNSDLYVVNQVYDGVDIFYSSANGYLDETGDRTDIIPTGLGTVSDTFTAKVLIGEGNYLEKSIDVNILKKAPYEIVNVGLTDESGNAVYDIQKASKISSVKVNVNAAGEAKLIAAVYNGGVLADAKLFDISQSGEINLNMSISGGDKVKLFVMDMSGITPLAFTKESYDVLSDKVTIHTIGDSLCATYTDNSGLIGWGQVAGDYFDSQKVVVDNSLSRGGMTAEEFIAKGRFDTLLSKLKKNDYVFIQLATNDCGYFSQKEFNELLSQLVLGAREKGAIPVFVTSPETKRAATDTSDGNGGYIASSYLGGFPDVMRNMAGQMDIPVIDVNNAFLALMREVGLSGINNLGYYVPDNVHFTNAGANFIAKTVADGVKALQLPIADYVLEK